MVASYYAWDPEFDCITKETDASGAVTARYTQEPRLYGGLISQDRSGASSYYHYDPVGTTRALTSSSQATTDIAVYTAFGEKAASVGSTVNQFGFVGALGYFANPVTNDMYVRERIYRPVLGRWASRDRLHPIDGVNGLAYVRNQPTRLVDPSGLICASPCCCCVDSLTLDKKSVTTMHDWIRSDTFGHHFFLDAQFTLKPGAKSGPCTLEWWEWADPGDESCEAKTWCDSAARSFANAYRLGVDVCGQIGKNPDASRDDIGEGTITPWCRFFHPTVYDMHSCEPDKKYEPLRLRDVPRIGKSPGSKRVLYFHVVITSAPDCECKGEKTQVWEGCQFLEMNAEGTIVSQELHENKEGKCPDFPVFKRPPPKRKKG